MGMGGRFVVVGAMFGSVELEGAQAVLRAEVEGLAVAPAVTALSRSTFIPHTGSVAPRRAVSQNSAAKIARPSMLSNSL